MSVNIECTNCGRSLGDVGLTETGTKVCDGCGEHVDVGEQTLAGAGEDWSPSGIRNPSVGDEVRIQANETGEIIEIVSDDMVVVEDSFGSTDLYGTDKLERPE